MKNKYSTMLSIAGSDSIGGAGIQADIKTATALGVYAMTAITAITAQNTLGVESFEAVSAEMLRRQLDAVWSDVVPDAVKIGMIPNAECAEVIAEFLEEKHAANVVVDPVMVATSGDSLTGRGVKEILVSKIFPLAAVVTPNIPEAETLSGLKIEKIADAPAVARQIAETGGSPAVLLKGGHMAENNVMTDTLFVGWTNTVRTFNHPFVETRNTHGTGCSLSSAIASFLAKGLSLTDSVERALQWETRAIKAGASMTLGNGNGPINHMFDIL